MHRRNPSLPRLRAILQSTLRLRSFLVLANLPFDRLAQMVLLPVDRVAQTFLPLVDRVAQTFLHHSSSARRSLEISMGLTLPCLSRHQNPRHQIVRSAFPSILTHSSRMQRQLGLTAGAACRRLPSSSPKACATLRAWTGGFACSCHSHSSAIVCACTRPRIIGTRKWSRRFLRWRVVPTDRGWRPFAHAAPSSRVRR